MSQVNQYVEVPQEAKYKLVAPDGGWGYLVVLAFIVQSVITNIPTTAFGLLYGDFLDSIGDETTGTALSTGLFFTAQSFSGFITDILLRKYNCRKVGVMGATLYFLGAFGQIFVHTIPHMILCFSAMQGLACGLLLAAIVSSFNSYFSKKMNLMMGIAQSVSILSVMLTPYFIETLMKTMGFRQTLCVLAGLALVILVAVSFLDPVEKHMKKVYMDGEVSTESLDADRTRMTDEGTLSISTIPIIPEESDTKTLGALEAKMRASLSNLGQRTISSMTLNKDQRKRGKVLDFRLLMDWKFMAINIGLSTSFAADVSFVALIPVLLGEINFSTEEIAFMMTMFFASDLGARILYSIINTFYTPKSRHVYLAGSVLSAIVRTIFSANNSSIWRLSTLATLGFLRCFIQTTLMLVLSEEYKDNFVSSFSISMILCGMVNLFFGLLGSFLKYSTGQSVIVLHLLTVGYVICIILWTVEMIYTRFKSKRETRNRLYHS